MDSHIAFKVHVVVLFSARAVWEEELRLVWQNDLKLLTSECDLYLREEDRSFIYSLCSVI